MREIFNSVTKLSLLLVVLGSIVFTGMGILDGKDFLMITSIIVTYYFSKKQPTDGNSQQ